MTRTGHVQPFQVEAVACEEAAALRVVMELVAMGLAMAVAWAMVMMVALVAMEIE